MFHLNKRFLLCLIALLVLVPSVVYAHGMFLTLEAPGVFKVEYDGGGFSPKTEVVLYDGEGRELERSPVDEEGKYHFDENLAVYRAVADDGMGHRTEYREGMEEKTIPKAPVVIAVFAVAGIVYSVYSKKKKV